MDGVQGWMAEIEHKQGWMTYLGAGMAVLAVAAAAVALVISVMGESKYATEDDLAALTEQVRSLRQEIEVDTQGRITKLNKRITALAESVDNLSKKQGADASDIAALQGKVNALRK